MKIVKNYFLLYFLFGLGQVVGVRCRVDWKATKGHRIDEMNLQFQLPVLSVSSDTPAPLKKAFHSRRALFAHVTKRAETGSEPVEQRDLPETLCKSWGRETSLSGGE